MIYFYAKLCWWIRHLRDRDVINSVRSGNWSDATTWDINVPKDGDTVFNNHTVTFDVDQSKFRLLNSRLINFGRFIVSRNPGHYCLRIPRGIDNCGQILCELPDETSTMTFDFPGNSEDGDIRCHGKADFKFQCAEPKFVGDL
jgi:hypothetical protein